MKPESLTCKLFPLSVQTPLIDNMECRLSEHRPRLITFIIDDQLTGLLKFVSDVFVWDVCLKIDVTDSDNTAHADSRHRMKQ